MLSFFNNAVRKYTAPIGGKVSQAVFYAYHPQTGERHYLLADPTSQKAEEAGGIGLRLFGGMVETGEDLLDALRRETMEEIVGEDWQNSNQRRALQIVDSSIQHLSDTAGALGMGQARKMRFKNVFRPDPSNPKQEGWLKTLNTNFAVQVSWDDLTHLEEVGRGTQSDEINDVQIIPENTLLYGLKSGQISMVYAGEQRALDYHINRLRRGDKRYGLDPNQRQRHI